jgi:hypothetical protein
MVLIISDTLGAIFSPYLFILIQFRIVHVLSVFHRWHDSIIILLDIGSQDLAFEGLEPSLTSQRILVLCITVMRSVILVYALDHP